MSFENGPRERAEGSDGTRSRIYYNIHCNLSRGRHLACLMSQIIEIILNTVATSTLLILHRLRRLSISALSVYIVAFNDNFIGFRSLTAGQNHDT